MSDHERKLRFARVVSQTAKGAAGGLISALALAGLVAVFMSGASYGQAGGKNAGPASPLGEAREECEAGARAPNGNARALGACDLLLRSGNLDERERGRVLTNRAVNAIRRGDARSALTDLSEAASLLPSSGAVELNRAAALIMTGRHSEAEDAAEQAIALGVGAPELAWLNRAIALERQGRYDAAYAAYREAAALAPDNRLIQAQPARFIQHQPAG